ncbi:MAG TPA: serine hydrolase [Candidatus Binatia bacterium]|jgi:CubicO group peptidase (beta-lactamase class C family)|nr:serine hydrolase [Candidatus Binatia bacterium]
MTPPKACIAHLCALVLALVGPARAADSANRAAYTGLPPDTFLKTWLILGPIPVAGDGKGTPSEAAQKKAFGDDWFAGQGGSSGVQPRAGLKQNIAGKDLEWRLVESKDDTIDLKPAAGASDFAIAYAWAEIDLPQATNCLLGIGSDDAVKVWLNGKLIHENWTDRPTVPDDDIVRARFERGRNLLLLKIQNMQGDWGFTCRRMGPEAQSAKLLRAARTSSDTDAVKKLLDQGVDVNTRGPAGITPWLGARLHGDTQMAEFLASRGADTNVARPALDAASDAVLNPLFKEDLPGVALLVAQDGKVRFVKGYGFADVEHHIPVTPQTQFRIGSITKQFTAAAILKLQEQGKLSITDKLSKYLPDFPRGDEVTLHHLLTHTSGIHSYTDKPGFLETVTNTTTTAALIKSFQKDPYDFNPGKKWSYDNSGFLLLGYIVEKVSGQSYGDFLRTSFFTPLGMTNTGVHHKGIALEHEALGYEYHNGKFSRALDWDMSWAGGAGALYSTVEDLFRWNEAVFNGKVLTEASLKAAFTPVKTEENKAENSPDGYGYGWMLSTLRGTQVIAHGGGLNGFSSMLMRVPAHNFTVVALANALPSKPGLDPGPMAQESVEFCLGEQLPPRTSPKSLQKISPAALDPLVGRYDYGRAIMTVEKEGSRLFARLTGQPRFEIFPESETNFFWKVVEAHVTFIKSADGKVTKAIHHQGGMTIDAPRLPDLKEFKADPVTYDAFVGKYDYGEGKSIMTVTREGDRLYAQLTGQPKFEIFPSSPTEFFWKVVDAQVAFVKDAAGKITKAVHHQNGQTVEAPKIE